MHPTVTSYPSRRTTRLHRYEYSQAGAYFVTLCIEQRQSLLGRITDGQIHLSPAGTMVAGVWSRLAQYYPVEGDAFVVMPNHLHGILVLEEGARGERDGVTVPTSSMSLSTIIQRFKTFTMHEYGHGVATGEWPRYQGRLWQHRFHEHVVRNERDLDAIREYIANNPRQWQMDRENPERVR
jgi:REP element-mobilizing transposase RayT